jgi:hypothetical protein
MKNPLHFAKKVFYPTLRRVFPPYRNEILYHQFNKRLETFALCYSQSLLLVDFKENHETRKLESIHKCHLLERKNEGRKPDKNSSLERL